MLKDTLHENDIHLHSARIDKLSEFDPEFAEVGVDVLRLDHIHPVISGNKYFKLLKPIERALNAGKTGIITYGGAYSNHLVATALACKINGLKSVGIVRGEEPKEYSPTLVDARSYGMELRFTPREQYGKNIPESNSEWEVVPEGGRSVAGIEGASTILKLFNADDYTHIICSVGTGTTIAGLMSEAPSHLRFVGLPALKISAEENELKNFITINGAHLNPDLIYDYHFGGYAKKTTQLIAFMNTFFDRFHIPTDFVYTGKLFYGVSDLVRKGYFGKKASLLVIHSGGLQGNRSLPFGALKF